MRTLQILPKHDRNRGFSKQKKQKLPKPDTGHETAILDKPKTKNSSFHFSLFQQNTNKP